MILQMIGNSLIVISVIFIFIGIMGVIKFDDFYAKLLSSSKIDTAAVVTLLFGLMIKSGISWFSAKCLLILIFFIFVNPIITTKIANSYRKEELMIKARGK